jgi:phospholipase C
MYIRRHRILVNAILPLALCMGLLAAVGATPGAGSSRVSAPGDLQKKIQHIVIIMQENRSFDQYFGTYPGADGLAAAQATATAQGTPALCLPDPRPGVGCDMPYHTTAQINYGAAHDYNAYQADVNGGAMNGFASYACSPMGLVNPTCTAATPAPAPGQPVPTPAPLDVMSYHTDAEIPNYWAYAGHYVLQDHMFAPSASYSAMTHLYMVSGWTGICPDNFPMNCTNAVSNTNIINDFLPPVPTATPLPIYAWTDITWLLQHRQVNAAGTPVPSGTPSPVNWAYFIGDGTSTTCYPSPGTIVTSTNTLCNPVLQPITGTPLIWNPLPLFTTVQQDNQISNVQPLANFVSALRNGTPLPSVMWIVPDQKHSEHPPFAVADGQAYVTALVNALMQSPIWSSTAIFISWDDWGGFYDHELPPHIDQNGLGIRVPGLLISPYAKQGLIDHQTLSFDSYLKFIEDVFLGGQRIDPATDGRPDPRISVRENAPQLGDLANDFDFSQTPAPPLILTPYAPTGTPSPTATATNSPTIAPPPPANTATPVLPATSTPQATATPSSIVRSSGPPPTLPPTSVPPTSAPTVAPTSTPVSLAARPSGSSVVSGKTLTISIQTAPHARVSGTVTETTPPKGKSAKAAFHLNFTGTADAHGRYTAKLHIAFKPSGPANLTVKVTARVGSASITRTFRVTVQPLAVTLGVKPATVAHGHDLTLSVQSVPKARVSVLVQVLTTRRVTTGSGKHKKQTTRVVVLYQLMLSGTTGSKGVFTGHARVQYRPSGRTGAGISVTVRSGGLQATGSGHLTITP